MPLLENAYGPWVESLSGYVTPALIFPLFLLLLIWSLVWKGLALWKAAHQESKLWFVALLLINTLGILEILYIFVFSKKSKPVEKIQDFTGR